MSGIEGRPELIGAVSAQIQSIDGVPLRARKPARRRNGAIPVGCRSHPRTKSRASPCVFQSKATCGTPAITRRKRRFLWARKPRRLLTCTSDPHIVWTTPQKTFPSTVVAVHKSESVRLTARVEFFITPDAVAGLPAIYYGGIRVKALDVAALQKAIYDRFPTITVVNMAEVLDTIQSVVDQISLIVRFVSGFSIFAGAVILASSVAGTRFRRIREVVILKTLGATRERVAKMFSVEFLVIGTVAGLMGGLLAGGFAWAVLNRLLNATTALDGFPVAVSIGATALLAVATGWLASFRTLGQKPLRNSARRMKPLVVLLLFAVRPVALRSDRRAAAKAPASPSKHRPRIRAAGLTSTLRNQRQSRSRFSSGRWKPWPRLPMDPNPCPRSLFRKAT